MLMLLLIAKCLVLYCGNNNPQWVFVCGYASLPAINELRDLGVTKTAAQEFGMNATLVAA